MSHKAEILRIERISPNDGRGLRTVVFFKGCPLRCKWCSTPESQRLKGELFYRKERCSGCGECVRRCPEQALSFDRSGEIAFDRKKCRMCGICADVCVRDARGIYGKKMTCEEVMRQIRKDEVFFYHSGGGVTISGGDVLLQADFARELLIACKNEEIHTAAELDLFGSYDEAAKLLPWLSEVFIDIKVMDPEKHFIWTGVRNTTILANAVRLAAEYRGKLHIRVPLIPGVSDNSENIQKTVEFCRGLSKCEDLEFLPYHRLGTDTYQRIGRNCLFKDVPSMTREEAEKKVSFLCRENLPFPVKVSGKKIFR